VDGLAHSHLPPQEGAAQWSNTSDKNPSDKNTSDKSGQPPQRYAEKAETVETDLERSMPTAEMEMEMESTAADPTESHAASPS
jgi:hypothetical protein